MKPYNIEIFDRNLNYKYSALIDPEEFAYSEDFMDPVKNTVNLPKDFNPSVLDPSDERAPRGWYIRIFEGDFEIQGIVTVFESDENGGKLTFSQMITRLDLNMLVDTGGISQGTIENYIKNLIQAEFINTSDQKQKIYGLSTVTTSSSTTGTFAYTDTDDSQVIIDFLNDLVYPAFELYSIVTDVRFNPQTKTISINIGQKNSHMTVEADLPNISSSSFTIQKYSKEINKIDAYDIYASPPTRHNYYLHPDGTWSSDASTNRITPVINAVSLVNGWAVAKAVIDAQLAAQYETFCALNENYRRLTTSEKSTLDAFATKAAAAYVADHQLSAPSVTGASEVSIGRTTYTTQQNYYDEYLSGLYWSDDVVEQRSRLEGEYTSCHVHTMLRATVTSSRVAYNQTFTDTATYQKPFTNQLASSGLSAYKKTTAYEDEIRAVYNSAVNAAMQDRAKALFAKNKYSNLIELTMLANDSMIKPLEREMGTAATIIHDGVAYSSILSGREIRNGLATLTFGTIRLELTSYLKGRY
jgi:hypothetical protein